MFFALLLAIPLLITAASTTTDGAKEHSSSTAIAAPAHAGHAMQKPAKSAAAKKSAAKKEGHCRDMAIAAYERSMQKMHQGMMVGYTGDADYDFVAGMIPHHQGAVDMALIVLKYGKNPEMKALAERIIIAQRQEIGFMSNWLRARKSSYRMADAKTRPSTIAYEKSMEVMHHGMMVGYTGDVDVDFARGMIPHHQGAVDMADILVEYGDAPELRELAHDIIRSQKQEIALMQDWLKTQTVQQPKTYKKKPKHEHHAHH